jgi:phospholipase A1/A2
MRNSFKATMGCCASVFLATVPAWAADSLTSCAAMEPDSARLACYDRLAGRNTAREVIARPTVTTAPDSGGAKASLLESSWEFERNASAFRIRPYKPVYFLPVFHTDRVNQEPHSPTLGTVSHPLILNSDEAKFQISFKSKLGNDLLGDNGDLWAGYTQSSRWQVYNKEDSRPFRETNYEPELMFVWRANLILPGMKARYASLGINHQSNGRSGPLSRSWNRVTAAVGLEGGDWTLTVRPWWRVPERNGQDDNPDIADYAGRGEVLLTRVLGEHVFSVLGRHSLRGGDRSHGSAQLDWAFPINGRLKGHIQWHSGYAESMIDYNHRANYLGLGVSLVEWH